MNIKTDERPLSGGVRADSAGRRGRAVVGSPVPEDLGGGDDREHPFRDHWPAREVRGRPGHPRVGHQHVGQEYAVRRPRQGAVGHTVRSGMPRAARPAASSEVYGPG